MTGFCLARVIFHVNEIHTSDRGPAFRAVKTKDLEGTHLLSPNQDPERSASIRGEATDLELVPPGTLQASVRPGARSGGFAGPYHLPTPRSPERGAAGHTQSRGLTWGGGLVDDVISVLLGDHGVAHGQEGEELLDAGGCGLQTGGEVTRLSGHR